jgi:hypothetical protein
MITLAEDLELLTPEQIEKALETGIKNNFLKELYKQMIEKRHAIATTHDDVSDESVVLCNQKIDMFNEVLNEAHHLHGISYALEWSLIKKIARLPKHLKPVILDEDKNYSSYLYFTWGNDRNPWVLCKREKWQETVPDQYTYLYTLFELRDHPHELLADCVIDEKTKVYFEGHGGAGIPYIADSLKNIFFGYQELANSFITSLTDHQLQLLKNQDHQHCLTIRLIACHAGSGYEKNSMDSFAALLQRELKDTHGIFTKIIANTRENRKGRIEQMSLNQSSIVNTKYGYTKEQVEKLETHVLSKNNPKYVKSWNQLNHLLIHNQPGSLVKFSFDADENQIRECALEGGEWRIQVYETIITHIDGNHGNLKKIDSYTKLLYDLHESDDEEQLFLKLQSIIDEPLTAKFYGIKSHSKSLFSSFYNNSIYHDIKTIVQERQYDLDVRNNNFSFTNHKKT